MPLGGQEVGFIIVVVILLIVGSRLRDGAVNYAKRQSREADEELKRKA